MSDKKDNYEWTSVDNTGKSEKFVNYLDITSSLEFFKVVKRESYSMLEVRKGSRVLDVGCGTGDDVLALAQIVGETGWAVGVDNSEKLIAEARKRAEDAKLPVEFKVGDAHKLEFSDDTFDGCRAERVFEHLDDPERALAEMIRVARPGARIFFGEPDWETLVVDIPDKTLTRKVLNQICDSTRNGWCGRQLPRLYKEMGLAEIRVVPRNFIITDYAIADQLYGLNIAAEELKKTGMLTEDDVIKWLEHLETASKSGTFFSAVVGFAVIGRKPKKTE